MHDNTLRMWTIIFSGKSKKKKKEEEKNAFTLWKDTARGTRAQYHLFRIFILTLLKTFETSLCLYVEMSQMIAHWQKVYSLQQKNENMTGTVKFGLKHESSIRHEHLAYCIPNRLMIANKPRHAGLQFRNALWPVSLYKGPLKQKKQKKRN